MIFFLRYLIEKSFAVKDELDCVGILPCDTYLTLLE